MCSDLLYSNASCQSVAWPLPPLPTPSNYSSLPYSPHPSVCSDVFFFHDFCGASIILQASNLRRHHDRRPRWARCLIRRKNPSRNIAPFARALAEFLYCRPACLCNFALSDVDCRSLRSAGRILDLHRRRWFFVSAIAGYSLPRQRNVILGILCLCEYCFYYSSIGWGRQYHPFSSHSNCFTPYVSVSICVFFINFKSSAANFNKNELLTLS